MRVSELYGHKGLSTVMTSDKNLQYEYKTEYNGFFKTENIGMYSSKIKNICDIIYNKETGVISEGIILIYSQYLYGGLIPMALALEEMGFIKYNSNSLFKTQPTNTVDIRTMKEPSNRSDFKPARYIMITGNMNLSPNNDKDVKAITNIDNIYDEETQKDISGEKIKVVLISQSGSEGIDFKAIRQVHILEPWYNMNRLEQVIGRAVRNLSHKWLPLKKRNVQIFLHGTVLDEETNESADVYIYRIAEYKAKQIGIVTRILKENAVDCLLNYGQTNFSQEKMNTTLNIILSTNPTEMIPYRVGDSPYSMTCDYMENCNYKCNSSEPTTTNEYSYDEAFSKANIETIINRIKRLFKEAFFYKKLELLKRINPQNRYSLIQIYTALTQLIDEKMFIKDKYDRTGYLVNIGEYYLFQPQELTNKNISLFDRSVPLNSIPEKVNIIFETENVEDERKEQTKREIIEKRPLLKLDNYNIDTPSGKLVSLMRKKYDKSIEILNKTEQELRQMKKVDYGEEMWIEQYIIIGLVMYNLSKYGLFINSETPISRDSILELLIEYIIDNLLPDEKIILLLYFLQLKKNEYETDDFLRLVKLYCDNLLIELTDEKGSPVTYGYIFYKNTRQYFLFYKEETTDEWTYKKVPYSKTAKYSDSQRMIQQQSNNLRDMVGRTFNHIIGFVDIKDNNTMVFKTKIMEKDPNVKRTPSGRICNKSTNKTQMLTILNSITGSSIYKMPNKDDKLVKRSHTFYNHIEITNTNIDINLTNENELCYITDFIVRYYEKIHLDDKIWFLNYEIQSFIDFSSIKPEQTTTMFEL